MQMHINMKVFFECVHNRTKKLLYYLFAPQGYGSALVLRIHFRFLYVCLGQVTKKYHDANAFIKCSRIHHFVEYRSKGTQNTDPTGSASLVASSSVFNSQQLCSFSWPGLSYGQLRLCLCPPLSSHFHNIQNSRNSGTIHGPSNLKK